MNKILKKKMYKVNLFKFGVDIICYDNGYNDLPGVKYLDIKSNDIKSMLIFDERTNSLSYPKRTLNFVMQANKLPLSSNSLYKNQQDIYRYIKEIVNKIRSTDVGYGEDSKISYDVKKNISIDLLFKEIKKQNREDKLNGLINGK